jgi:hypothetical protein
LFLQSSRRLCTTGDTITKHLLNLHINKRLFPEQFDFRIGIPTENADYKLTSTGIV